MRYGAPGPGYTGRSGVNRIAGAAAARIGMISAGTSYLALRQALASLGIDQAGSTPAGSGC